MGAMGWAVNCHSPQRARKIHSPGGQALDHRRLARSFSDNEAEQELTSRSNGSGIDGGRQSKD
jgi:hypothetical protein